RPDPVRPGSGPRHLGDLPERGAGQHRSVLGGGDVRGDRGHPAAAHVHLGRVRVVRPVRARTSPRKSALVSLPSSFVKTTSAATNRRHDAPPLTLLGSFRVAVVVPVGDEHETLDGTLVRMTGKTVAVEMHDGTSALTVSIAPRAVLVFGEPGRE